jgi:hypothetical protein
MKTSEEVEAELHESLTSPLDAGEWSELHAGRVTPMERDNVQTGWYWLSRQRKIVGFYDNCDEHL